MSDPRAFHNDNEPTTFGAIPTDLDELDRIAAWLRVEMAEDDTDLRALVRDAQLVRGVIETLRPRPRVAPSLSLVG